MSNYEVFCETVSQFFEKNGISFEMQLTIHDASLNDEGKQYLYNGKYDKFPVVSMDAIAQDGYHLLKEIPADRERNINTVDAFCIDVEGEWYFIEFKDCKISGNRKKLRDNIDKKGMANWLMMQDIFFSIGEEKCSNLIDLRNPCEFARKKITYILVFDGLKDPYSYEKVREMDKQGKHYTPNCMNKFKDYFFKDAYAYTVEFFEQRFLKEIQKFQKA